MTREAASAIRRSRIVNEVVARRTSRPARNRRRRGSGPRGLSVDHRIRISVGRRAGRRRRLRTRGTVSALRRRPADRGRIRKSDSAGPRGAVGVSANPVGLADCGPATPFTPSPTASPNTKAIAELTISLLDRRLLAGDAAMFECSMSVSRHLSSKRGAAIAERAGRGCTEARRAKFQNTIYHLEPNIKDTPGGLRDLQTVRWLARCIRAMYPRTIWPRPSIFWPRCASACMRLPGAIRTCSSFDAQEALSEHPAALMRDYYPPRARWWIAPLASAIETAPRNRRQPAGPLSRLALAPFDLRIQRVRDRVLLREPQQLARPRTCSNSPRGINCGSRPIPSTGWRASCPQTTWDDWKRLLALPHASLGLRAMQEPGRSPRCCRNGATSNAWWCAIFIIATRWMSIRWWPSHRSNRSRDGRVLPDLFAEIHDPWTGALRAAAARHRKGRGHDHVAESLRIARDVLERLERRPSRSRHHRISGRASSGSFRRDDLARSVTTPPPRSCSPRGSAPSSG